jgi:hypothetical protein
MSPGHGEALMDALEEAVARAPVEGGDASGTGAVSVALDEACDADAVVACGGSAGAMAIAASGDGNASVSMSKMSLSAAASI